MQKQAKTNTIAEYLCQ